MIGHRRDFVDAVCGDDAAGLEVACLLMGREVAPELDVDAGLRALDGLAEIVGAGLPGDATPAGIGRHLRATLGGDVGFGGSAADYDDLRSSLLHEVLRRHRGLPILLSVVWLGVARRLDVPAHGIGLPGHFVVGIGDPAAAGAPPGAESGLALVDPFAGGVPLPPEAAYQLCGHDPTPHDLRPWTTERTVLRILTNIRTWARRADRVRTRLWAVELALLLPGCPEDVRREHGETLARTGDFAAAATALESYAATVEEGRPLAARDARAEARIARARLN